MAERRDKFISRTALGLGIIAVFALGLDIGRKSREHVVQSVPPSPVTSESNGEFTSLLPLQLREAQSNAEFINFFDTVFNEFERARLTVPLPNDPSSFVLGSREVRFYVGGRVGRSDVSRYTLERGKLQDSVIRVIKIADTDGRMAENYQLIDDQEITGRDYRHAEEWSKLSTVLLSDYNEFAGSRNQYIDLRREYETDPSKFFGR